MKNSKELFYKELDRLLADEKIRRLKEFPQHNGSNTLRHVTAVAKRSFELAEKFGWDIDEKELARSAILHDYYLYKIKEEGLTPFQHGTSHPAIAIRNARKDFGLSEKETKIIRSHMWPLTLAHPPRSKEAALLCIADKDIAIKEFVSPEVQKAGRVIRKVASKSANKKKTGNKSTDIKKDK